jgi:hypothetical protein
MENPSSRPSPAITAEDLKNDEAFQGRWYHSIELLPGLFTQGQDHVNISATRKLLKGCAVEGMNCLDIGTQNGLTAILLKRRGASRVTGQDIQNFSPQMNLVMKTLGIDGRVYEFDGLPEPDSFPPPKAFNYIMGRNTFDNLRPISKTLGIFPYDVVVFSGVLYHMLDPFTGLLTVRGLVRDGGLLLIETVAVVDDSLCAYFNAGGRLGGRGNFFLVSVELLDYMLRVLKLAPLDCAFVQRQKATPPQGRIAVLCRAVGEQPVPEDDTWAPYLAQPKNLFTPSFLDWEELKTGAPEVAYTPSGAKLIHRKDTGTVNLYETLQVNNPTPIKDLDEQVRLKLDATY